MLDTLVFLFGHNQHASFKRNLKFYSSKISFLHQLFLANHQKMISIDDKIHHLFHVCLAEAVGQAFLMYYLHIVFVWMLFAYLPWSKPGHIFYHTVALFYVRMNGSKDKTYWWVQEQFICKKFELPGRRPLCPIVQVKCPCCDRHGFGHWQGTVWNQGNRRLCIFVFEVKMYHCFCLVDYFLASFIFEYMVYFL